MTYKQFDVVVVPFPFTEKTAFKKRPALVISDLAFNQSMNKCVMAMITTTGHFAWFLDVSLVDLDVSGLKSPSLVRMKLFTLDNALVLKKIGILADSDRNKVQIALKQLFSLV